MPDRSWQYIAGTMNIITRASKPRDFFAHLNTPAGLSLPKPRIF